MTYNHFDSHKCISCLEDALRYYIHAAKRGVVAVVASDHMLGLDEIGMKYDLDGDIPQRGPIMLREDLCISVI